MIWVKVLQIWLPAARMAWLGSFWIGKAYQQLRWLEACTWQVWSPPRWMESVQGSLLCRWIFNQPSIATYYWSSTLEPIETIGIKNTLQTETVAACLWHRTILFCTSQTDICIQKERTHYMSPNRIKEHTYITLYKKSYDFITFICMVSIWSLHVIIKYIRTKRHNNNTQTVALCNKASIWHLLIKPIAKNKKNKKKNRGDPNSKLRHQV